MRYLLLIAQSYTEWMLLLTDLFIYYIIYTYVHQNWSCVIPFLTDCFFVVKPLIVVGEQEDFSSANAQRSTDTTSGNKQYENRITYYSLDAIWEVIWLKLQLKCDLFWKLEYVASCFRCFLSGGDENVISVYADVSMKGLIEGFCLIHCRCHWLRMKKREHLDPRGQRHTWPDWVFWLRPGQQNFSMLHWDTDTKTGDVIIWLGNMKQEMDLRSWDIRTCRHGGGFTVFTSTVTLRLFRRLQSPGSRLNAISSLSGLMVPERSDVSTWENHQFKFDHHKRSSFPLMMLQTIWWLVLLDSFAAFFLK